VIQLCIAHFLDRHPELNTHEFGNGRISFKKMAAIAFSLGATVELSPTEGSESEREYVPKFPGAG
jgi:hypothetical protein